MQHKELQRKSHPVSDELLLQACLSIVHSSWTEKYQFSYQLPDIIIEPLPQVITLLLTVHQPNPVTITLTVCSCSMNGSWCYAVYPRLLLMACVQEVKCLQQPSLSGSGTSKPDSRPLVMKKSDFFPSFCLLCEWDAVIIHRDVYCVWCVWEREKKQKETNRTL